MHPTCSTRDIEAAKALVAQSGVSTPIKVRFQMQATPVNTRLGELIQTQTAEAGFEVELTPFDNATALQNQVDGNFDISLGRWSGRVDPDANIYRFQHSTGSDNYGKATDRGDRRPPRPGAYRIRPGCSQGASTPQVEEKVRARRNAITFQHEVLYSAHTTDLQGYALYVDGMPRLAHAYLAGG